jgi:hypothetical protein
VCLSPVSSLGAGAARGAGHLRVIPPG